MTDTRLKMSKEIGIVHECLDCGFKKLYLSYPEDAYKGLQRYQVRSGHAGECGNCEKTNTVYKQLKWKELVALKEKYSNNKILTISKDENVVVYPEGKGEKI